LRSSGAGQHGGDDLEAARALGASLPPLFQLGASSSSRIRSQHLCFLSPPAVHAHIDDENIMATYEQRPKLMGRSDSIPDTPTTAVQESFLDGTPYDKLKETSQYDSVSPLSSL